VSNPGLKRIRRYWKAQQSRPNPESAEEAQLRGMKGVELLLNLADEVLAGKVSHPPVTQEELDMLARRKPHHYELWCLLTSVAERQLEAYPKEMKKDSVEAVASGIKKAQPDAEDESE
jgi:hypothetical protein